MNQNTFISDLSKTEFPLADKISGKLLQPSVLSLIQKEFPTFNDSQFLSITEFNEYRQKYVSTYLVKEIGELNELEKTVLKSLDNTGFLVDKIEDEVTVLNLGQRIADKVASFGGSWTFIISFFVFILIWISINVLWVANKGFDPYPFILLNLILSCIAALQAPVIMMSQNRQEEKDRERAKKDYMINLKSELEIRILHEKIDHLIMHQQKELIEIQQVQIGMMNDILTTIKK
jgi:uncharacterized membrane protein